MNLALLLDAAARSFPHLPAVSVADRPHYDYAAYGALAARLAAGFHALGLAPGDRVVLAMTNNPEYLAALFAVWRAGLVAAPANAKLHAREIAFLASDCSAKLCLATPDLAEGLVRELGPPTRLIVLGDDDWRRLTRADPAGIADRRGDDLAWLFYTSGTTGRPKGAMLSHRNLMTMATLYLVDVDALFPGDAHFHLAAQSHATGLFGLSHIAKATHQVLPASGGFSPSELADLLRLHVSASFFVPPTGLRRMLRDPAFQRAPIENIRTVLLGAAPVYAADLKAGYEALGPRLWNGYGQGESPCTITAMPKPLLAAAIAAGDEARMVSVGLAGPGSRSPSSIPTTGRWAQARSARWSCAATPSWPATGTCPRPRRTRCGEAGCTPATSARWTRRAFSPCSTAPKTSSSPAAPISTRARSKTCCSNIHTSPKRPSSARPIPNGARASWRSSCRATVASTSPNSTPFA